MWDDPDINDQIAAMKDTFAKMIWSVHRRSRTKLDASADIIFLSLVHFLHITTAADEDPVSILRQMQANTLSLWWRGVFWKIVGEGLQSSLREATTYEDKNPATGKGRRRRIPKTTSFNEVSHGGKQDDDPFDWRLYVHDACRRLPQILQEIAALYLYEDMSIERFMELKGWSRRDWQRERNEMFVQMAIAMRTIAQERSQQKKRKRERSGDGSEADDAGDLL